MAHVEFARNPECIEQRAAGEETAQQNQSEVHDKEQETEEEDEPGFGLGLPGLASLTLSSEGMVVPPLNFSMV